MMPLFLARACRRATVVPRVIIAVLCASCSNLTHVAAPDVQQAGNYNNPAGALLRRAGTITQFANAYANALMLSGLVADEFSDRSGGSYAADQRLIASDGTNEGYPYDVLSATHVNALRAAQTLEQYSPTPPEYIGEMFAYSGYVEVMFAEHMCSGVPVASVVDFLPTAAPSLTRSELLTRALADFDSASVHVSSADTVIRYLAQVGRARALLDSGNAVTAGAVADSVPLAFAYSIAYDGNNQTNGIFSFITSGLNASISDHEGGNGLDFVTAADPRVPITALGPGTDGDSVYALPGVTGGNTPAILASGVEAGLIRAEARLDGGNIAAWAQTLDTLRTGAITPALPVLQPDSSTGADSATAVSVMFRERAFWLFGTGHRQGDLRRLVRVYRRSIESVFPTGVYQHGPARYGAAVAFAPFGETTNPDYAGCVDRGP